MRFTAYTSSVCVRLCNPWIRFVLYTQCLEIDYAAVGTQGKCNGIAECRRLADCTELSVQGDSTDSEC